MMGIRTVKNISLGAFAAACLTVAGGGVIASASQNGEARQNWQSNQQNQHEQNNNQNGQGGQQDLNGQGGQNGQNGQQGQNGQSGQQNQGGQNGQNNQIGQQNQGGQNSQQGQNDQNGQNGQNNQSAQNGQNGQSGQQVQNGQNGQGATSGDSMQTGQQDQDESRMARADRMMSDMHMAHDEFMQQMESHMSGWDDSERAGLDTEIQEIMTEHRMEMDRAMAEYRMHIEQGMNHDEARNMLINQFDSHKARAMNEMHEARNQWIDWANNRSNGMVTGEEKDRFINNFNHTMDWYGNQMEHIKNNQ